MKTFYVMRHAKSNWTDTQLTDFERPLSGRGRTDAPFMGAMIQQEGIKPDFIFSSPANRSITTARLVSEQINFPLKNIIIREEIYDATLPELFGFIEEMSPDLDNFIIFGHNPALTQLINKLTDLEIENFPTCAICGITIPIEDWKNIQYTKGESIFYAFPKKYRKF